MCNECWKEFRGWCKSFTKTEVLLALLEVVLLIICVAFIVFLIGHFIVCRSLQSDSADTTACAATEPHNSVFVSISTNTDVTIATTNHTTTDDLHTTTVQTNDSGETTDESTTPTQHTTLSRDVECTWTPSYKTDAETRYYVGNVTTKPQEETTDQVSKETVYAEDNVNDNYKSPEIKHRVRGHYPPLNDIDRLTMDDESDGKEAADEYRALVLALVRRRPDGLDVFACAVTAVSEHWAVTAASCVDAVDETDSLDACGMVERWGDPTSTRWHAVTDVSVHPRYGAAPTHHDAAALRSADPLLRGARPLALPPLAHHMLLTIGERLTVLGFGPFRSAGKRGRLRAARVYTVGASQCADSDDGWSSRHLAGGAPLTHAACARPVLCAGVLRARAAPCGYCAGTPLVRRRALLGVASAAPCAEACHPAPYTNLAALADWLRDVVQPHNDV